MKKQIFSLSVVAIVFSSSLGLSASALKRSAPSIEPNASITSCIAKNHKLQALMVVDESISLFRTRDKNKNVRPGTDMGDERVTALKAVTQVLLDRVNEIDPKRRSDVSVALSGFGNSYKPHQDWMALNNDSVQSFLKVIEGQAERETSRYTRYHEALKGALTTFENPNSGEGSACRMLIWFSDGQHDDDDEGSVMDLHAGEIKQVQKDICGSNGLADKLRLQGVYTVAAGLNENRKAMGLMQLVSQGDGAIKLKNRTLTSCGNVQPEGKFAVASGAGDLVATLVKLIDNGTEEPRTEACRVGEVLEPNCSQISFVVDSRVSRFTLFVNRGDDDVVASLESEQTGKTTLFGKIQDPNIQQTVLSEKSAYIRVARRKDGAIDGRWTLKFNGLHHADARALVRFVGEAKVDLTTLLPTGEVVKANSIDRFETGSLQIKVTSKTDGTSLEGAQLEFKTKNGLRELDSFSENGVITVPAEKLKAALSEDLLKDVLETELLVTPIGTVEGITDPETGKNMPIDFDEFSFKLRITNGSRFPEYLGLDATIDGVDSNGTPIFKGTNKRVIAFRFKGASETDSVITFSDDIESDIGLKFVSGQNCNVKKAVETVCSLELKPTKESNGAHSAIIQTVSTAKGTGDTQNGEIPIELETQLPNNVTRGVLAAVILILSFLLIQGIQRYFFAWLITRYSPLNSTSKRVRLDVRIDNGGMVSFNPRTEVSAIDESFNFDNVESSLGFDAFGYHFGCSPTRTFMRSTSSPHGEVTHVSRHVIGLSGVVAPKKDALSRGLVDLALRNQWVIGIDTAEIHSLLDGAISAEAELVVFLEPYAKKSREDQMGDLEFSIASSNLSQMFTSLLENLRSKVDVEPEAPEKEIDVFSSNDGFSEPWGQTTIDFNLEAGTKSKKSRRDSKKKNETGDVGFEPPTSGYSDDPFA